MMKAFLIEKPNNGSVCELPLPELMEDEVLIEVAAVGVCGTDVHIFKGEYFGGYPRVPGHEFCGTIVKKGNHAKLYEIGQFVTADPNMFCESCDACKENHQNFCQNFHAAGVSRHGAYAQFVAIPERCVFDITGFTPEEGAMIEPLACVVYGQERAGVPLGGNVLIFGAGPIGLMHLQLAAKNGAAAVTVVDLFPHKLELAKKLGADFVYTAEEWKTCGQKNHYELVIDATGVPAAVEQEMPYVKDAGTWLIFGVCPENSRISINPYEIFRRELKILGSYSLKKTTGKAIALIRSKKIDVESLIENRLALDEVSDFFHSCSDLNPHMKTVIYPNQK